ncbi:MAG TPA: hypothetical protein VG276_28835 [Actinomycetes bacterium]|jgi:hypothetical protein|nr:hypothetical protein [Actinomycetes bacterium]
MTAMAEHDRSERLEAGNGNYWRDPDGVWRYAWGDGPVPRARDRLDADGEVVGLDAPELAPDALVDAHTIARERGWQPQTLRMVVHRRRHCPPVVSFTGNGQPALYSRAAIKKFDAWLAAKLNAAGLDASRWPPRLLAARDRSREFADMLNDQGH